MTVQARNDDDLDWKDIMSRLAGSAVTGVPTPQTNSKYEDGEIDAAPVFFDHSPVTGALLLLKSVGYRVQKAVEDLFVHGTLLVLCSAQRVTWDFLLVLFKLT
ncbi:unnamed protein product [Echinostoma caproni]|uniref:Mrr_cat domain-containing protein n=1 Tax=Echinostoma caproni TaxID=27848 RepID=A0A183A1L6_9TREM|nr:unnamed protein product [Echinostoma caproni]